MAKTKKTTKGLVVGKVRIPNFSALRVTAQDIKEGKVGDEEYCPIALAARRQVGSMGKYLDRVSAAEGNVTLIFDLPVMVTVANGVKATIESNPIRVNVTTRLGKAGAAFMDAFDAEDTDTEYRILDTDDARVAGRKRVALAKAKTQVKPQTFRGKVVVEAD